jgi:hypothetical protein
MKPRTFSTSLIFKEFNVLTVRQLYLKCVIKYVNRYRVNFEISDVSLGYYSLRPNIANYFKIYRTNLTSLRRQLLYISSKLANKIPIFSGKF